MKNLRNLTPPPDFFLATPLSIITTIKKCLKDVGGIHVFSVDYDVFESELFALHHR